MAVRRAVLWILLVVVATGTGWAVTRNVDKDNVGCNDTSCAPCCTIQAAVGKSSGGDVISVATGTYDENVDLRYMASYGDLTLQAKDGVGTVTVSPSSGIALRHSVHSPNPTLANTVTVEGITLESANESCLWFNHAGSAVLRDVVADNCGERGFTLDNDGTVTMERCTGNGSQGTTGIGIEIEGATGVTLTDCAANSTLNGPGFSIYSPSGSVEITNPTAQNNGAAGIDLEINGPLTITGATLTDNGRAGIYALSTSTVEISSSVVTGSKNGWEGVKLEGKDAMNTIDSVTLTGLQSNGNEDNGVSLAFVNGPVTLTSCSFEDNGSDGLDIWDSVLDDLVITGGHATGNDDYGYNVESTGDATVDGAQADTNYDRGVTFKMTGTVSFANCSASGNELGEGIRVESFNSDDLDEVTITDCTANDNGLLDGGNGIYVKEVTGPVTISGTTTNGNSRTNIRVDATAGEVMISDCTANSSSEEGIKIDADVGPVTIANCTADGNTSEGLRIQKENHDIAGVTVTKNVLTNNGASGVFLDNLDLSADPEAFDLICNDIVGNSDGLYLNSATTVDARYVWWGAVNGPSGDGTGSGDSVGAVAGGTVHFTPWFTEPCAGCVGAINLTLEDYSCNSPETYEACYSITVGPNSAVYGPSGDLTLTAPLIVFEDDFFVDVDGSLTASSP